MKYTVKFTPEAEKDLDGLDRETERRVRRRMKELAFDPYSMRLSKPLRMFKAMRSSRVGGWRILYEVNEPENFIKIIAIRPRSEAYR